MDGAMVPLAAPKFKDPVIAPKFLIQMLLIFLKTHYGNILSYAKQERQTKLEIMLEEAKWTLRRTGNGEHPRSPFNSSL